MRSDCSATSSGTRRSAWSASPAASSPQAFPRRSLPSRLLRPIAGPLCVRRETVMITTSRPRSFRLLAALALAAAGCSVDAAGKIPCVDDVSCPTDYPVCGPAATCIAGTSSQTASVAIAGVDGHAASDYLSGTVRVLVSARASSGVQTVALASGSTSFTASATAAAPPLFAFDVNTTLVANSDTAPFVATVTGGDGTTKTANGTLRIDNSAPAIASFTVLGGGSTAVMTAGSSIAITATFTGGTGTLISNTTGGSASIASGGSVTVSPADVESYKLRVTSRSGVIRETGTAGQPSNVTITVVAPATFTGVATVSPSS